VLIDALARLPRGDVTLALAGGAGWRGEADRLRDQVTRLGLWGRVRVLGTSCLDVCGKGVTVALDNGRERLIVDPETEREALLSRIRELASA
jgi:hypothetical protein